MNYRTGLLLLGLLAGVAFFAASMAQAAPVEKITICHAAGDAETTHYIELTLSPNGVFGGNDQAGHFNEDGTPKAGHGSSLTVAMGDSPGNSRQEAGVHRLKTTHRSV